MRYPAMDDFFARFVVAETGAAVLNVDYDVAPRHRYPVVQLLGVPGRDHYFLDGDRTHARGVLDLFTAGLTVAYLRA